MNDDLLPHFWKQERACGGRLKEYFEDRTVAEMSIWFWIAGVSSFIFLALAVGVVLHLAAGAGELGAAITAATVLGGFALWLTLLVWLWISFVRIARRWGPERLGTPIFRYLQMGFLVMTAVTMLGHGEELKIWLLVLLAFDFVVMGIVPVFLLLAWSARCKVPWQTYREILTMVLLFGVQIVLVR